MPTVRTDASISRSWSPRRRIDAKLSNQIRDALRRMETFISLPGNPGLEVLYILGVLRCFDSISYKEYQREVYPTATYGGYIPNFGETTYLSHLEIYNKSSKYVYEDQFRTVGYVEPLRASHAPQVYEPQVYPPSTVDLPKFNTFGEAVQALFDLPKVQALFHLSGYNEVEQTKVRHIDSFSDVRLPGSTAARKPSCVERLLVQIPIKTSMHVYDIHIARGDIWDTWDAFGNTSKSQAPLVLRVVEKIYSSKRKENLYSSATLLLEITWFNIHNLLTALRELREHKRVITIIGVSESKLLRWWIPPTRVVPGVHKNIIADSYSAFKTSGVEAEERHKSRGREVGYDLAASYDLDASYDLAACYDDGEFLDKALL